MAVVFEIDSDTRFRVERLEATPLGKDHTDRVFVDEAMRGVAYGALTGDLEVAQRVIAFWGRGEIVQQDEPDPPGKPGTVY